MRLADQLPVQLGDVQLVPALLQVIGPAQTAEVEPLVMRLLLLLAAAPGQVRPREGIIAALWPGTTVGDDSVHRAIAQARRALAASGGGARIETVPRTGYRLVVDATSAPAPPAPPPAPETLSDPQRRRWLAAAAGGGAVLVAGSAMWWRNRQSQRSPRIAALVTQSQHMARQALPDAERQGVALLTEAARLAPDDAGIWGLLALALRSEAEFSPPGRVAAAMTAAEQAARRALALEPGQPDARAALILLQPLHGNWWAAEQGFSAILAAAPDHLPSLDGLSQIQAGAGLIRLHYGWRKRTVALDPLHAGYNFRSIYAHWMNGDIAAADRAGALGLDLWPRHVATWYARLSVFAYTGRPERALAMLRERQDSPPMPPPFITMLNKLCLALADGGVAARSQALAACQATAGRGGPFGAVGSSMALAALGAAEAALAVIQGFLLERGPSGASPVWKPGQVLHNDVRRRFTNFLFTPVMAPVWALPGFDDVLQAIGLVDYWRQSGHAPDFRTASGVKA